MRYIIRYRPIYIYEADTKRTYRKACKTYIQADKYPQTLDRHTLRSTETERESDTEKQERYILLKCYQYMNIFDPRHENRRNSTFWKAHTYIRLYLYINICTCKCICVIIVYIFVHIYIYVYVPMWRTIIYRFVVSSGDRDGLDSIIRVLIQ